ncbi:MAG: formylglycine-generating enzyme family protein [Ardenticatenaceae bacterium]
MKRSVIKVFIVAFVLLMILACETEPRPPVTPLIIPEDTKVPEPTCDGDMIPFEAESGRFCLDTYEVTNGAYQECVEAGRCTVPDKTTSVTRLDEVYYGNAQYNDYPVIRVTWYQADQYCEYVRKRLPTAAEWEQAAHAPAYYEPWPSMETIMGAHQDTAAVGSTGDVSPEGVHNLGDNVREWVADSDKQKPSEKVLKGQSFYSIDRELSSRPPSKPDWGIGFRCAVNTP